MDVWTFWSKLSIASWISLVNFSKITWYIIWALFSQLLRFLYFTQLYQELSLKSIEHAWINKLKIKKQNSYA